MATIDPPQPQLDAFHLARSKFLDAFAACEIEVTRLMFLVASGSSADSLGNKVQSLGKAKASPQYSAAKKTKVDALLHQLDALTKLRNDLVHSRIKIAWIDSEAFACIVNVGEQVPVGQAARLFSLDDLRELRTKTSHLANSFHQQVDSISKPAKPNPPSSPQPPSPGAKGDP